MVGTPWGAVRVKLKLLGEEMVSASPEYEDCAASPGGQACPWQR